MVSGKTCNNARRTKPARTAMIPTIPTSVSPQPAADDTRQRFFLDDAFDAAADGDWWLDLGAVVVPTAAV
jgi:hypothetical protein